MLQNKGILSPTQKSILTSFSRIKDYASFYLTGGTALAEFSLGHRRSYDLDLFTPEKGLILPFSRIVDDAFPKQGFSIKMVHPRFIRVSLISGQNSTFQWIGQGHRTIWAMRMLRCWKRIRKLKNIR